jgi:hypothetical protein
VDADFCYAEHHRNVTGRAVRSTNVTHVVEVEVSFVCVFYEQRNKLQTRVQDGDYSARALEEKLGSKLPIQDPAEAQDSLRVESTVV